MLSREHPAHLHARREARDDVRAVARAACRGDFAHGGVEVVREVLCHKDERVRRADPDEPARREALPPALRLRTDVRRFSSGRSIATRNKVPNARSL